MPQTSHTPSLDLQSMLPAMQARTESDGALVALALAGDIAAFDILAARYRRRMLSQAMRVSGSVDDAEDIVQYALLKAFVSLGKYRRAAQFSTWLTRIVINEALMFRRKAKRHPHYSPPSFQADNDIPEVPELRASDPDPESAASQRQWNHLLTRAIDQLKPASRVVLQVRALEENSVAETAELLGLSIPAVKSREARARQALREKLGRHWMPPQRSRASASQSVVRESA